MKAEALNKTDAQQLCAHRRSFLAILPWPLVCAALLGAFGSTGCATASADRVAKATDVLNRAQLVERLESLSETADTLLSLRQVLEEGQEITRLAHSLGDGLGEAVLQTLLDQVDLLNVAWKMVESLEVMKQFWAAVDELQRVPRDLRAAMREANRNPSDQTVQRFDQACLDAQKVLGRTLRLAGTLKTWTRAATLALSLADQQLDALGRELDFWGSSLVIEGVKKVVRSFGAKAIAAAAQELSSLEAQLEADMKVLDHARAALTQRD